MCIILAYGKLFRILKDKKGREYGWKVFVLNDKGYVGQYCGTSTVRPRGKWLKAEEYSPPSQEMESAARIHGYEAGWHVFRKRSEAIQYGRAFSSRRIVKVLVRKIRERGYLSLLSRPLNCFIADEIFISA